jgi:hypothetical protein
MDAKSLFRGSEARVVPPVGRIADELGLELGSGGGGIAPSLELVGAAAVGYCARLGGHNGVGASRVPTVREEVAEVGGEVDGRETVGVT